MILESSIKKATEQFFIDILNADFSSHSMYKKSRSFCTKIDISGDENYSIYIYANKKSLKKIAYLLLFDENPTNEVLIDVLAELSNIIVGSAKVEASNQNCKFDITTPLFLGEKGKFTSFDFMQNYMFENQVLTIIAKQTK